MPTKNKYGRKFLNPISSSDNGSLKYHVSVDYDDDDGSFEMSGGFIVFDCRKGIELDLYGNNSTFRGKKRLKNSIKKLRMLAEEANKCADFIENQYENVSNIK